MRMTCKLNPCCGDPYKCTGSDPVITTEPVVEIDLDDEFWKSIKEAANQSTWIPKEYYMNDWVEDVCRFLRDGTGIKNV